MVGRLEASDLPSQEGHLAVILIIPVIVSFILFSGIVLASISTSPQNTSTSPALLAVNEMVKLDSVVIKNPNQIFDDAEYRLLKSDPELVAIAHRLRRDRQELALTWLDLLIRDIRKLFRFHSLLVRGGVPIELSEEVAVFFRFVSSILLLAVFRSCIRLCGPFALHGTARRAKVAIESLCCASANALDRLPPRRWGEVAQTWRNDECAV